ncbi:MAG: cytochrome c [Nitrospinae bacterium]|nr:cytochrome c [Nitrospinota bacterium]
MMKRLGAPFFAGLFLLAFCLVSFVSVKGAYALREKSAAELEAAKKAGDQSLEEAQRKADEYGSEATSGNVEHVGTDATAKGIGQGNSAYGVAGFDYLTGVGKVASDPSRIDEKTFKIKSANKSPLEDLMKKRFENKWTGQYNDSQSGWANKTGVTEVWFRSHNVGELGADYNGWANQWNNITRPRHEGKTPIPGSDPDQGAHWFSFYCVHCHGWTGKGDGPTAAKLDPRPRNLTNGNYANFITNLQLFGAIKGGGEFRNLSAAMPPWGNVLQDQDIWNVVAFIRTLATPKYTLDPDDVTAAGSMTNEAFKEQNEMLESDGFMGGRGLNKGGYSSIGGGRLASEKVGIGGVGTSDTNKAATIGDWAEDKK